MNSFAELALSASEKFAESIEIPPVVVVGDFIIDLHRICYCERIAQESPVPVWKESQQIILPGGAAAVADFANDLDCRVALVSAAGSDELSTELLQALKGDGVYCEGVATVGDWQPTLKERIWVEGPGSVIQMSARMDSDAEKFPEWFEPTTSAPDIMPADHAVIVADYGKGFVIPSLLQIPDGVQTFVDPAPGLNGDLRAIYAGKTDWLILNEAEFEGLQYGPGGPGNLIRKRDRSGVVILTESGDSFSFAGILERPRYVSGAGDMFIAAFTAATRCGLSPEEAGAVGHLAAALLIRDFPFDRQKIDRGLIHEFACELSDSVSE